MLKTCLIVFFYETKQSTSTGNGILKHNQQNISLGFLADVFQIIKIQWM